ncbi:hypothetical protein E6Q11_00120 [Candidatus Dojkabacteria bacterium]|uniref:Uncharacterized protein n=1 Tax=Candidatus Dojkabacteria bacterium TaxID=2099670 RepID=A0A5C7JBU4_9BACT|nr:MAG: hypothetical protein E6Q11_00120 [Candidatus Dojkabacteria bacterium]
MKRNALNWLIGFTACIVILSVMGGIEHVDQELSAKVLEEAKAQARSEYKAQHESKYAALDAQGRYMTSFDRIAEAK